MRIRQSRQIGQRQPAEFAHAGLTANTPTRTGRLRGSILHFTIEHRSQLSAKNEFYTSLFADKARRGRKRIALHKVWFNPPWRFFRDYILCLGVLDGSACSVIAFEGTRYTYLKYSKIAPATGGYRQPNWLGVTTAAAAFVLSGFILHNHNKPPVHPLPPATTQLAAYDDNYEDDGVVLPVDDDGIA